ncbi:TatD family hydrolase [Rothia sp. P13129]|uniref:TatD family hydrolase n=1 Tax=Rothia sp. P13129 TaxID=3402664 RepID=UPI003AC2C65C
MCTSKNQPNDRDFTTEELTHYAQKLGIHLPTEEAQQSIFTNTPHPTTGQTPPAYESSHYNLHNTETGEGTGRRSNTGTNGSARNLVFPPAPEPLPAPVIDNHTHMDLLDGNVNISVRDALDTGEALGISHVVQVGCDVESSLYSLAVANMDTRVLSAVALHPNEAPRLHQQGKLEESLAIIDRLAQQTRVCAIGETGLDYFRTDEEGRSPQHESFREHIRIAKKYGKALQIHDRDAHEDVVRILLEEGAPERTVFHCFSGDEHLAKICMEQGWYMSFSGTVTFKNSHGIQKALEIADPSLILVETDAPFLTPHPYRGRPNASYMTNYTVRFMAERRESELEQFCELLTQNSHIVYGSWAERMR